jgi:hypothetical protein
MSIVANKYRGSTKYFRVHGELVRAAQYRGVTTYQDVARILALPITGSHMGAEDLTSASSGRLPDQHHRTDVRES